MLSCRKVDIKVINASLSQNQCLQRISTNLEHVEIPRPCDTTELNNDGVIKFVDVHYQTEFLPQSWGRGRHRGSGWYRSKERW